MQQAGEGEEAGAVAPEITNRPLSQKLQIPSSKLQRNPKLQTSKGVRRVMFLFGCWFFEISLGFGDSRISGTR
jgi:hypothetical protein